MNLKIHPFLLLLHYYINNGRTELQQTLIVIFFICFYNRMIDLSLCFFVMFIKTVSPLARKILQRNKQQKQRPAKAGNAEKQNSLQKIKNGKTKYSNNIMYRGEETFELYFQLFANKHRSEKRQKVESKTQQEYRR